MLWNASALTGYIFSTFPSLTLWHLKAYFLFWTSGDGSKYSTATLPVNSWGYFRSWEEMVDSLTFDGTENIALLIRERFDASGLIPQTWLSLLLYISSVSQVPHKNFSACSSNQQLVSTQRHCIYLLKCKQITNYQCDIVFMVLTGRLRVVFPELWDGKRQHCVCNLALDM